MPNVVRILITAKDEVSGVVDKIQDKATLLSKTDIGKGMLQGAGIAGFNMLKGAALGALDAVVDFARGSVQAAADEERGIARMNASLAANVKGWEGQADAIEKGIKAGERLGFSDDAVRESLSRLVGSTHDVGKAFELMAVAQDLARKKGISLEDASTALIKVEGGQYRALKELGIVLKEGATATEALAEVQKVAGGQAAAYTETLAGKTEILANKMDNLQETVGGAVIPYLSDLATVALSTGDALETAFGDGPMEDREDAALDFGRALSGIIPGLSGMTDKIDALDQSLDDHREEVNTTARTWDTGSERVGSAVYEMSSDVRAATRKMKLSFGSVTEWLLGEYNEDFDRAMGIQEARLDLHNAETDRDKAQAYADLAELGALSEKDYANWIATLERLAKSTKGKVHDAYAAALADLRKLRSAASKPIYVDVIYRRQGREIGNGNEDPNDPGAASGGPRTGLTWVGEQGPELVDVGAGAHVYTAGDSARMAASGGGGGGPVVIQLNVDGREMARVVDRHLYYEAARAPRSSYAG